MNVAKKLFDGIVLGGELAIQQLIDEKQDEYQYLDFKQAETNSAPMKDSDRKTLGKALSGFANTDGGVIVWGVKCAKKNGLDIPTDLMPISKIDDFKTDLERETPQAAEPYVMGVEHKIVPGKVLGTGYVITYVPEWDGFPVKSCVAKNSSFYMRTGGRFSQMPYSFLADRFGRRPQAKLRVSAQVTERLSDNLVEFFLHAENLGRGLAEKVCVLIVPPATNGSSSWPYTDEMIIGEVAKKPLLRCFESGIERRVYPNMTRCFYQGSKPVNDGEIDAWLKPGEIGYQIYCDGYHHKGKLTVCAPEQSATHKTIELCDLAIPGDCG